MAGLQEALVWAARVAQLRGYVFGTDTGYAALRPGKLTWKEAEALDGDVEAARAAAATHVASLRRNTKSAALAAEDFAHGTALAEIAGAPFAVRVYAQAWFMSAMRHDGVSVAGKVAAAKAGVRPTKVRAPAVLRDWMADIHVPAYVPPIGRPGEPATRQEAAGYFVGHWWEASARIPSTQPRLVAEGLHDASVLGMGGGSRYILPAGVVPQNWHDCERLGVSASHSGRIVTLRYPGGTIATGERKVMPPWTRPEGPVGRMHPWDGIVFGL